MKTNSNFKNKFSAFLLFAVCLLGLTCVRELKAGEPTDREISEKEKTAEDLSKTWSGDSYRRSIELFLEASGERLKLEDPAKSTENLRRAANLFFLLADYKSAKSHLFKAVEIDEKNKNPAGQAKSFALLSLIFSEEGDNRQSEDFYKKAVEAAEISGDPHARATALLSEAEYGYYQTDADTLVGLYERILSYGEKTGDTKLLARILLNASYAHSKQGNPVKALETAQNSLMKWREIGDKRGQATTYTAIGLAYKMLNEEQNALDAYYNAEALFPADMDLIEKARLSTGIASIYSKYNENNLTKKYLQNAYDLFGEAQYPVGQLAVLPDLIKLNYSTNNNEQAEKYYEEVKRLAKKFKYEIFLAYTGEIIGSEKLAEGLFDDAVREYDSALQIFQKYKNKKGIALLYQRLGEALNKQGKYSDAVEHFKRSLAVNREIRDTFSEAENLFQLAKIDSTRGNKEHALKLVKNTIELTEHLYSDIPNTKLKSTYFSSSFDRYELFINLLMNLNEKSDDKKFAVEALQAAERSRARAMRETLSLTEADFTKDANPETIRRENEIRSLLNLKSDKLTDLLSQNAGKNEIEKLDDEINDLHNQLEQIRADLRKNSPVYSSVKNPAPFDLREFQESVLDENSLLLEFSFGTEKSFLWTIGKNEFDFYTLPPRRQIETKIQNLREILDSREIKPAEEIADYQTRIAQADLEFRQKARDLSNDLFGQIAGKLSNKRLIIVPDGKLFYFPVSALPLPGSETDEPMLLTNETVYEPSAQTLLFLTKLRDQTPSAEKDLLVFADPVFSFEDSRILSGNKTEEVSQVANTVGRFRFAESLDKLPRLTASEKEAEVISDIFYSSENDVYSGFSATRENALSPATANYKIIHFATHGIVNEDRPELSGIVLSGFNPDGQKIEQIIRLQDIYGMNLKSDLVILSACNTGIGKEVRGEGLTSLNNAFLSIGAKSVMSSLWKVEDGATLELMKNFYDAMANERLTPSKALQKAQIKMFRSNRYQSPFYWAAFTVQGDYQNVPDVSKGFGIWVYLLPVAVVLFSGVFFGFRFIRRRNHK